MSTTTSPEPFYVDELVSLYQGDCLELSDIWTAGDVLVTDPPYGVGWCSGNQGRPTPRTRHYPVTRIKGDNNTDVRDRALGMWGDRPAIIFGHWKAPRPANVRVRLIWHKTGKPPGIGAPDLPWTTVDEEIYVLGRGWVGGKTPGLIATHEFRAGASGHAARIGHPTPKPLDLMEQLITHAPPGLIVDPFAGSGSTLLAAKALGRKAIGIELEARYCEIAANRLAQNILPGA